MMDDMPRPRPPHLHRETTRHGKTVWFVRIGKGPRIRIRGEYGTPEFTAAYDAAVAGTPRPDPKKVAKGTLKWLWERYREGSAWLALGRATRRQRENIMTHVLATSGDVPFAAIARKDIVAGRERRAATPHAARHFIDTMRGMFEWAVEAEHLKTDPTLGVKAPQVKKGPGFKMWTDGEVEQYENRWPLGTKERVWLDVLLYTGLRRGDAVRLGPKHVWNGEASLKTEKSGEEVEVTIPILPILQRTLDAGPISDETFIIGKHGKGYTKESFGNAFKDACKAAGINENNKAAHGLRKVGSTRCAENGATVHQLMALFGWRTEKEALVYTKKADRKRLGRDAVQLLEKREPPQPAEVVELKARRTQNERSIPAPDK